MILKGYAEPKNISGGPLVSLNGQNGMGSWLDEPKGNLASQFEKYPAKKESAPPG